LEAVVHFSGIAYGCNSQTEEQSFSMLVKGK